MVVSVLAPMASMTCGWPAVKETAVVCSDPPLIDMEPLTPLKSLPLPPLPLPQLVLLFVRIPLSALFCPQMPLLPPLALPLVDGTLTMNTVRALADLPATSTLSVAAELLVPTKLSAPRPLMALAT